MNIIDMMENNSRVVYESVLSDHSDVQCLNPSWTLLFSLPEESRSISFKTEKYNCTPSKFSLAAHKAIILTALLSHCQAHHTEMRHVNKNHTSRRVLSCFIHVCKTLFKHFNFPFVEKRGRNTANHSFSTQCVI